MHCTGRFPQSALLAHLKWSRTSNPLFHDKDAKLQESPMASGGFVSHSPIKSNSSAILLSTTADQMAGHRRLRRLRLVRGDDALQLAPDEARTATTLPAGELIDRT
jgi:hypothetical protein